MFPEKALAWGKVRNPMRELFEYGIKRKAEIGEENVFDFSLGNPSVAPPPSLDKAIVDIINSKTPGIHGYTTACGIPSLREKIADNLMDFYGLSADPNLIYVTCGATAALSICMHSLLQPKDECIVLAPTFPEYRIFVEGAGGKLTVVPAAQNFHLNPLDLEKAITKNTRAMIINSPNNPTGVLLSKKDIEDIAKILKHYSQVNKRTIYLITDEPYREIVYDLAKVPSVLDIYDDSIMCYSFSKSLSIPGERIGYIVVNKKATNAQDLYCTIMGAARYLGYVNPPSLFQRVIAKCIGQTSDISEYDTNRKLLMNGLKQIGYDFVKPEGAFYLFLKSLEPDAKAFSERAKKYELLLVPSDDFECTGYVRVSYCVAQSVILRSLPAFKALYDDYKNI